MNNYNMVLFKNQRVLNRSTVGLQEAISCQKEPTILPVDLLCWALDGAITTSYQLSAFTDLLGRSCWPRRVELRGLQDRRAAPEGRAQHRVPVCGEDVAAKRVVPD